MPKTSYFPDDHLDDLKHDQSKRFGVDIEKNDAKLYDFMISTTVSDWKFSITMNIPTMENLIAVRDAIDKFIKTFIPDDACPYCKGSGKGTMTMDKTKVSVDCHFCLGKGKAK